MNQHTSCTRREQILRAAEQLFLHYGFAKTTVADIARQAAVAVGSVYLEFASKDAIVAEFSICRYQTVLQALHAIVHGGDPTLPCAQRLSQFFAHRLQAFASLAAQGQHACELVACTSEAVNASYQRYAVEELALVQALLQTGTDREEFAALNNLQLTARALVRAYATYAPPWGGAKIPGDIQTLLAAQDALVLAGLLQRRA